MIRRHSLLSGRKTRRAVGQQRVWAKEVAYQGSASARLLAHLFLCGGETGKTLLILFALLGASPHQKAKTSLPP